MGVQSRGWVSPVRDVVGLAVWLDRSMAFEQVSPVVQGEVSEGLATVALQTVPERRVGSGKKCLLRLEEACGLYCRA